MANALNRAPSTQDSLASSDASVASILERCPQQTLFCGKRALAFRVFGAAVAEAAQVVLYFHGVPSCHIEAGVLAEHAEQMGVAVVAIDRPGIGSSTFDPRLSLTSFAEDCCRVLDRLEVGRPVIVIGNSGGGPYAAGFAALHPARCATLGLLAPVAPTDRKAKAHRDNLRSMEGFDRVQLSLARGFMGAPWLWLIHRLMRHMAKKHPDLLLEYAPKGLAEVDGLLMQRDQRIRDSFPLALQHTYLTGAKGVTKDVKTLGRPWGVDPGQVACRTLIWHGSDDKCIPIAHSRFYASQIAGSEMRVIEGEGHVTLAVRQGGPFLEALLAEAATATAAAAAGGPDPVVATAE